jgi:hypothetical protein
MDGAPAAHFAFMADVPLDAKKQKRVGLFTMLRAVFKEDGPYIPAGLVQELLGVSRQRVHQLIKDEKIKTVIVDGHHFVTEASLKAYLAESEERGHNLPRNHRQAMKMAMSWSKSSD